MKLKCRPADFVVTEQSDFPIRAKGEFAVYELTKRGIGTPEAVTQLLQMWKIRRDELSYGGLKDKHALTRQFVTVHRGPARNARRDLWDLKYLGQTDHPFRPANILGNGFQIVMRDMSAEEIDRATQALREVKEAGLPNYFDDQRFGSVTSDGEFIARPWIAGDFEKTLWLGLTAPSPHDRSSEKREKAILRDHWKDWTTCQHQLGRSHRRSIVSYLVDHPDDFAGAWARVRQDMRSLYLAAFQSHLWNRILAAAIYSDCPDDARVDVPLIMGPAPFFRSLPVTPRLDLATTLIPLPSSRTIYDEESWITHLTDLVLEREGLHRKQMKVKQPRDCYFSKGERAAMIRPADLTFSSGPDEMHPNKQALRLAFSLPRGAYATILVKRITAAASALALLEHDEPVEDEVEPESQDD